MYETAIFCIEPQKRKAVVCETVDTHNKSAKYATQWYYDRREHYDETTESLLRLGFKQKGHKKGHEKGHKKGHLYLDIYDSEKPSLTYWEEAQTVSNQMWVLTPLYTSAQLDELVIAPP